MAGGFLDELHARNEAEFGVDLGEVGLHGPLGDGSLRRSKLVVDELGRIEGLIVSVIEGVRADVERLRVVLQLSMMAPTSPAVQQNAPPD